MKKYKYRHEIEAVQWDGKERTLRRLIEIFGDVFSANIMGNDVPRLAIGDQLIEKESLVCQCNNGDGYIFNISTEELERDYEPVGDSIVGKVIEVKNESSYPICVIPYANGVLIKDLKGSDSAGLEGGWKTIESVPKDGQMVLFYCEGGISIAPARPPVELTKKQQLELIKHSGEWPDYKKWTPTHWMPLPTTPAQ